MTSAPRSPSCCAAHGPSTTVVQSRIRTPASGPAIGFPPYRQLLVILAASRTSAKHGGKRVRNSPQRPHSLPTCLASGGVIRQSSKGGCHAQHLDEPIGQGL